MLIKSHGCHHPATLPTTQDSGPDHRFCARAVFLTVPARKRSGCLRRAGVAAGGCLWRDGSAVGANSKSGSRMRSVNLRASWVRCPSRVLVGRHGNAERVSEARWGLTPGSWTRGLCG